MMTNKNEWERSFGPWAVRRCDVYVVSFNSPGLVEKRLDVAKDLWKAGINADLVSPSPHSPLTRMARGNEADLIL